jgi:organic hydroperoxide reductase OsmC/OhrA
MDAKSENGILDLAVQYPVLGGATMILSESRNAAAGYAACFDSALNLVIKKRKSELVKSVSANVGIGPNTTGDLLEAALHANIV